MAKRKVKDLIPLTTRGENLVLAYAQEVIEFLQNCSNTCVYCSSTEEFDQKLENGAFAPNATIFVQDGYLDDSDSTEQHEPYWLIYTAGFEDAYKDLLGDGRQGTPKAKLEAEGTYADLIMDVRIRPFLVRSIPDTPLTVYVMPYLEMNPFILPISYDLCSMAYDATWRAVNCKDLSCIKQLKIDEFGRYKYPFFMLNLKEKSLHSLEISTAQTDVAGHFVIECKSTRLYRVDDQQFKLLQEEQYKDISEEEFKEEKKEIKKSDTAVEDGELFTIYNETEH